MNPGEPPGAVTASYQVIYMAGWSPAPSQPKPKPRGSATRSLADLGEEISKIGELHNVEDWERQQ